MDPSISPSEPIRIFPADPLKGTTQTKQDQTNTTNSMQTEYENMSCAEVTHRLAETYKELAGILGTQAITPTSSTSTCSSSLSSCDKSNNKSNNNNNIDNTGGDNWLLQQETLTDDALDEHQVVTDPNLDDGAKKSKLTRLFWRSASAGDTDKVRYLLETFNKWIDIDAKDEDGTTPLIYAVCFGKLEIAQILLTSGAKIDIQDSFGWTALMWATNNNHDHIVKILLEHGASSQTKSSKGRTVFDFVNADNQKIVDILATNPRDSLSSTSSLFGRHLSTQFSSSSTSSLSVSSSTKTNDDYDFYYQPTMEGYDAFTTEEAIDRRRKLLLESTLALGTMTTEDGDNTTDDDNDNDSDFGDINNDFQWDRCLPDQMFVFGADDLSYILDTVITNIQLPLRSQHEICIPANVIFLSARFAHYFSTEELLNQVLDGSLQRIIGIIKTNIENIHILAFWMTNLTQLLHYLKKDTGLVVATANHQLNMSELISETYTTLVNDTEHRIAKILGHAMLDHNEIPGIDDVNFADDWQRFFRARQSKRNTISSISTNTVISPQSITNLLSSTLFVLRSYDVHPTIIIQAMAQFIHYLSCELFNRILTNKKLLCRSKAMQIRMNLSQIEDWVSDNHLPAQLASYLTPTTQLLQLLQCLTQLTDLVDFINTIKTFDALNALQMKRCAMNYRYEVNEPRLPEEIEKYAMQLAEDTTRLQQKDNRRSSFLQRQSSSSSFMSSDDDELDKDEETKDSKFMLPFSIPSSAASIDERKLVPVIPEDWMDILDNGHITTN
ncbi:hypothetical protein BC941DRAFT_403529 [Chlamydoabsidia padenii]|nr:hypothetical protein BC941DRAFT_403529 [Chlamydoabsidia padenii]